MYSDPTLFAVASDWILGHLQSHVNIDVGERHFTELDDAVLFLPNINNAFGML